MNSEYSKQALSLLKKGQVEEADKVLTDALKDNKSLERAWLSLYASSETIAQQIYCLVKVTEYNPRHEKAKAELARLVSNQETELENIQKNPEKTPEQEPSSPSIKHKPAFRMEHQFDVSEEIVVSETKRNSKARGNQKTKKDKKEKEPELVSRKKKRVNEEDFTAYRKPTVIVINKGENPYAKDDKSYTGLPKIGSGMYGYRLIIDGISITPQDIPRCIEKGRFLPKSQCHSCEFFSMKECPFRDDPYLLRDAYILYAQQKRYWEEYKKRRETIINAIYDELKEHGRPLHYEVIGKMMKDRYPRLKLTALKILHMMKWHPEKFEWVGEGVYRAK